MKYHMDYCQEHPEVNFACSAKHRNLQDVCSYYSFTRARHCYSQPQFPMFQELSKVAGLQKKVEEVKGIMVDNIEQARFSCSLNCLRWSGFDCITS